MTAFSRTKRTKMAKRYFLLFYPHFLRAIRTPSNVGRSGHRVAEPPTYLPTLDKHQTV